MEIIKVDNIDELNECLKIREEVFTKEQNVPKKIEVDEYDELNEKCNHFLVRYNGKNIGTIRCQNKVNNTIKLQRFCILKEYRSMGFGKIIIDYIENYYKNENIKTIELDAQYYLLNFYQKLGYKKVSIPFIEASIKHIKMIKNL